MRDGLSACPVSPATARRVLQGAALLFLAACAPAHAADTVEFGTLDLPFTLTLEATPDGPDAATLTVTNQLVSRMDNRPFVGLHDGSLYVGVYIHQALGAEPDTITIEPPEGYIAVPRSVTLNEGETATIRIIALGDALLG